MNNKYILFKMAEIEEVPLDIQETAIDTQETNQEIEDIIEEIPVPKKKGRPPGARNKAKASAASNPVVPKQKAKAKKKKPVVEYEYESEEEIPLPRRKVSQEADRHALAAEVLGLLQQQRYARTNARRTHYASWFGNM